MGLESELPNAKYIRKFNQDVANSTTGLELSIVLPSLFKRYNSMKDLLLKNDIPIDKMELCGERMTYSGRSDDTGEYSIFIDTQTKEEIVSLETDKNTAGAGKITNLMGVIKGYISLYEKNSE